MNLEKWTIQDLENEYLEEKFRRTQKPVDKWRGSDMGSCFRKRIYARQGVQPTETLDERTRRVLDTGDIFHWKYQNFLKRIGILVAKEIEIVNKEYNYIGHFDALVGGKPKVEKKHFEFIDKQTGEKKFNEKMYNWTIKRMKKIKELPLLLYDFKTQHSQSFYYLEKQGPQKEHVYQVASYLTFIDKKKYPVNQGRILYISKDDSRLLEFTVEFNKKMEQKIKDELKELQRYWDEKKLPDKLPDVENQSGKLSPNWRCRFCPYLTHCKGEQWYKKTMIKTEYLNKKYATENKKSS